MYFYMLFKHKCVLAVFTQPCYIDTNPSSVFFYLLKSLPLSQIEPILEACLCDITQTQAPPTIVWLTVVFQHRLDWCLTLDLPCVSYHQSAIVSTLEHKMQTRMTPGDLGVLWLDVIMNISVVYYSRYLSRWRRSRLHLFLKGITLPLPIYLNACMFTRIIRDPASPTKKSEYAFFFL